MQEGIAGADDDPPAALAGESLIADDRQGRGLISDCIPKAAARRAGASG